MMSLLECAGAHLLASCDQQRYRTAWLIGPPLSGKSTLARQLCELHSWRYLNYTLEEGYFDRLHHYLETYQPDDFIADLRQWCDGCDRAVLLVDEIDAILACWSIDQRRLFATRASRLPDLPQGLILVSNLFDVDLLLPLLPVNDLPPFFYVPGVSR